MKGKQRESEGKWGGGGGALVNAGVTTMPKRKNSGLE